MVQLCWRKDYRARIQKKLVRVEHCRVFSVNTCLIYLDSRWDLCFTLTRIASVSWEIRQNLTIFFVSFPVKVTFEKVFLRKLLPVFYQLQFYQRRTSFAGLFVCLFILICDKKCRPITFRWLLLFIAFTQVVFREKICFIETTSFNYYFTEIWLILSLLGGHSLSKEDVIDFVQMASL